ncbi:MAG: MTH1187 family thiamine-binding protein [Cyanobacteriota bacterium]
MAIVDLVIVPLGTGSTSLSKYVANCHKVLDQYPDVKWILNPSSTTLEGDLNRILEVIMKMHEVPFTEGAQRVATQIRIDDRRDKIGTMEQKLKSVEDKLK